MNAYPLLKTLKTAKIGRLVIYAPVLTSTMDVVKNISFGHGTAIIARKQTNAIGRSNNQVGHHRCEIHIEKCSSNKLISFFSGLAQRVVPYSRCNYMFPCRAHLDNDCLCCSI